MTRVSASSRGRARDHYGRGVAVGIAIGSEETRLRAEIARLRRENVLLMIRPPPGVRPAAELAQEHEAVSRLKRELEEAKNAKTFADARVKAAEDASVSSRKDADTIAAKHAHVAAAVVRLHRDLAEAKGALASVKAQKDGNIETLKKRIENLTAQIDQVRTSHTGELQRREGALTSLQARLAQCALEREREISSLTRKLEEAKNAESAADTRAKAAEDASAIFKKNAEMIANDLASVKSEKDKKIQVLENKINDLTAEIGKVRTSQKSELKRRQREITTLRAKLAQCALEREREISRLTRKLEEAKNAESIADTRAKAADAAGIISRKNADTIANELAELQSAFARFWATRKAPTVDAWVTRADKAVYPATKLQTIEQEAKPRKDMSTGSTDTRTKDTDAPDGLIRKPPVPATSAVVKRGIGVPPREPSDVSTVTSGGSTGPIILPVTAGSYVLPVQSGLMRGLTWLYHSVTG